MESSTQSSLEGSQSQSQSQSSDNTTTYQSLKSYPFKSDPEFATGLSIILSHPQTPASESEIDRDDDLVLQAKCFFYSRKFNISPPINFSSYKAWLFNTPTSAETPAPAPTEGQATEPATSTAGSGGSGEPAYPSSFAHIVELITTGQPIPGIQEIPDTVLEGHDISSEKPRRRKPWEKEESVQAQGSGGEGGGATATATAATTTSGEATTGDATATTAENVA